MPTPSTRRRSRRLCWPPSTRGAPMRQAPSPPSAWDLRHRLLGHGLHSTTICPEVLARRDAIFPALIASVFLASVVVSAFTGRRATSRFASVLLLTAEPVNERACFLIFPHGHCCPYRGGVSSSALPVAERPPPGGAEHEGPVATGLPHVSVAELDEAITWQSATLGIAAISAR